MKLKSVKKHTNKYKKYRKYKKNRTNKLKLYKNKIIKGGNKDILTANRFEEVVHFIKDRTIDSNIEYEECGTIEIIDRKYVVKLHEVPRTDMTRQSCNFEYYNNIIWHSHPQSSKFYPSIEDILKSIKVKNRNIVYSYIFTKFGFWTLHTIHHIDFQDDRIQRQITELLNNLYFETSRGREYNAEAVGKFIDSFNQMLSGILEISFTVY